MLDLQNITTELLSAENGFYILRGVSLAMKKGEILGLAGESGSGKSVLARTILGLNKPPVVMTGGKIYVCGREMVSQKDFESVRGKRVSMIFQNPTSSLNPVMTVGSQLIETIRLHDKTISRDAASNDAAELLKSVEIDRPHERLEAYPHQLSGGMNQRVMIALALASKPEILIADEPTTALDVTIQEQIIKLLTKLNYERGLSTLFISHDLSLLSAVCGRIAVLYSGELMEVTTGQALKSGDLHHPYTKALKDCIPHIGATGTLNTIKGSIGKNDETKNSCCIFAERCVYAQDDCFKTKPLFNGMYACLHPLKGEGKRNG